MTMTPDQLKAARILLHIEQRDLAEMADVGIATIRRFESGQKVRRAFVAALERQIEQAGIVLVPGGGADTSEAGETGVGVILRPAEQLPQVTKDRIGKNRVKRTRNAPSRGAPINDEGQEHSERFSYMKAEGGADPDDRV